MRDVAVRAQHIDLRGIALRKILAVAHAHHLRAALLRSAGLARDVREVTRLARVGDLHDRGPAILLPSGKRINCAAAMMADIRDPAAGLLVPPPLTRPPPLDLRTPP